MAGADEVEGTLLVHAPPEIELAGVEHLGRFAAGGRRRAAEAHSAQAAGTVLQYRYQDDGRIGGRLQVRLKPAKVSAETLAFVRLDRDKMDVHYQLDLHVRQGSLRQIQFTLPAAVGEKIQIVPLVSAARVIEQRCSPLPGAGDDKADLSLVADRPGPARCGRPDAGPGFRADLGRRPRLQPPHRSPENRPPPRPTLPRVVPVLALRNVSRQSGMVAVEAAGDQQIDCQPENLRELNPADVPKPQGLRRRPPDRCGLSISAIAVRADDRGHAPRAGIRC